MMQKVHFKQYLLLYPQVPFKDSILTLDHINSSFEETPSETYLVKSLRNSREENRDSEVPFSFLR